MSVPYQSATSGSIAREEITKVLRKFGCEAVGFMDDFEGRTVLLAFKHRGRPVQLKASANGWASLYLKENPWTSRRRCSEREWKDAAVKQGLVAINSILRDWVKGQVTAVECGLLSFEGVFMPYMLTSDGQPLVERIMSMDVLPPPS